MDAPIEIAPLARRSAGNTIFDTNELIIPGGSDRWEGFGVQFEVPPCAGPCINSADVCEDEIPFPPCVSPAYVSQNAFRASYSVTCNAAQLTSREAQEEFFANIRRDHEASLHKAVASGFWNGVGSATGLVDVPVSGVLTAGPTSTVSAVGLLMQMMSQTGSGSEGVFHMSPYVANIAASKGLLYRQAGRLRTVVGDHLVVADGGYSGAGPGGTAATPGSQWIYATGPVFYAIGESHFPAGFVLSENMDRKANRLCVPVETFAVVVFDPCQWFAAEVDLSCGTGCC